MGCVFSSNNLLTVEHLHDCAIARQRLVDFKMDFVPTDEESDILTIAQHLIKTLTQIIARGPRNYKKGGTTDKLINRFNLYWSILECEVLRAEARRHPSKNEEILEELVNKSINDTTHQFELTFM